MKKIAIIGASVGGLVAAAELQQDGFNVTIFEGGKSIGGMYGRVETPFGSQEMGMHVLYLRERHYDHLCAIFGADALHTWTGPSVDLASTYNFGRNSNNSVYPDLRNHVAVELVRSQVLANNRSNCQPTNALEAVVGRFGEQAGRHVYAPILKKLWKTDACLLSADAIHCFYDLRRVVLWDKEEADRLKADPWLDGVIANPDQNRPRSEVFGGRIAARFKSCTGDLGGRVDDWLGRSGINVEFGKRAEIRDSRVWIDNEPLDEHFEACIVATPVATLMPKMLPSMDLLELSIYYFRLTKSLAGDFSAYYLLVHEERLLSSRIVNYDAYNVEDGVIRAPVISVEVVHSVGQRPDIEIIAAELKEVFPMVDIAESYTFPNCLKIPTPSLKNEQLINEAVDGMETYYSAGSLYFTGMRTDKGIFFSHHTIGLAHESALDCSRKLS